MAGSNLVQWRWVKLVDQQGNPAGEKFQFRTANLIIGLGVSIGGWSDWTDMEVDTVTIVTS